MTEQEDVSQVLDDLKARDGYARARGLVVVVIALTVLLAVVLGVNLLRDSFSRTEENAATVEAIQSERARAVRINCEDINRRHRDTIEALDKLIADFKKRGERARYLEAKRSRPGTVLLISALVPMRNCDRLVERSVVAERP